MKNRKTIFTATVLVLAFALAPMGQSAPSPDGGPTHPLANEAPYPDGGPTHPLANEAPRPDGGPAHQSSTVRANASSEAIPEGENLPVITIHSTDNVIRGKTGSFVLNMKPALMLGGSYVNISVSGTAVSGVDYVSLVSPTYIGQSGYGTILVQTLPDPRGSANRQSYSVVVTLKPGAGYAVGAPSSATMWIKP